MNHHTTARTTLPLLGIILGLVLAGSTMAGPVWTCSIVTSVAVQDDGTVGPIDLGDLEPPTFIRVDTKAGEVTLLAPESRKGEVTPIGEVNQGDGIWVITGLEASRAWSMVISDQGYVTLSVTGDGATWSVFGHALLEEE